MAQRSLTDDLVEVASSLGSVGLGDGMRYLLSGLAKKHPGLKKAFPDLFSSHLQHQIARLARAEAVDVLGEELQDEADLDGGVATGDDDVLRLDSLNGLANAGSGALQDLAEAEGDSAIDKIFAKLDKRLNRGIKDPYVKEVAEDLEDQAKEEAKAELRSILDDPSSLLGLDGLSLDDLGDLYENTGDNLIASLEASGKLLHDETMMSYPLNSIFLQIATLWIT